MKFSVITAVGFTVTLAVLGHTVWHGPMTSLADLVVGFFVGGHIS